MKNTNYIINGILAVAVIVLFILQFTGKKGTNDQAVHVSTDSIGARLPIAYIRTDSLLSNYNYYKDLSESTLKKVENQKGVVNQRYQQLQKEILEFNQKRQNNAFLTPQRAQEEGSRLERKGQELEEFAARAEQELGREQVLLRQQLSDTIVSALKIFNQTKKYQVIFSNSGTDNILYADDAYDITQEVTQFLNARYVPVKK